MAIPARCVIGVDGVIAYAEVNPDYMRRSDPADPCNTVVRCTTALCAGTQPTHARE
ncbi:MAG TPA: hypothetical protein VE684_03510 [Crenalkalicoccus sp.]|jgi:hypothetical protein|nr:hypothetical protein [Crenalkalicoccus sp.]